MSTGQEIEMKAAAARNALDCYRDKIIKNLTEPTVLVLIGRKVSAARARKLRHRGELVRCTGRTETGKPTFHWLPKRNFVIFPQ